ncbi:phage baseplate plug family protein [Silvimonas soli]|uniref:phage baseplate plug family protein n=1 Tax=Silvimonas soli TaxID=2980100 RepID=UPI0024B3B950|nr:hypothetical protein [Silvimonas soli]
MPSYFEIPLSATPQTFPITLSGVDYRMTVQFRNADQGGWVLDVADGQSNPLVQGIPLVTGVNLLAPYGHLGFTGRLWVQTTNDPDAIPTYANLGTDSHVYWVTD